MKTIYVVHGWSGSPEEGWFPWLKKELESKNFKVEILSMPNANHPKIEEWVTYLKKQVKKIDEDTSFLGHSIGCQTILRYLEGIDKKISKAVLVAPWVHLKPECIADKESQEIAKPWLEKTINWDKIKHNKYIYIFSDNDSCVPLEDSEIFKQKLKAKIIIEHNKGHFSGEDNIKELNVVLKEILK